MHHCSDRGRTLIKACAHKKNILKKTDCIIATSHSIILEMYKFFDDRSTRNMMWAAGNVTMSTRLFKVFINTLRSRQNDAVCPTTFSNTFSWIKMCKFRIVVTPQHGRPTVEYNVLRVQVKFAHSLLRGGWPWMEDNLCLLWDYLCLLYP